MFVHRGHHSSFTITAVKLRDALSFLGPLFSIGLPPRHVTNMCKTPYINSVLGSMALNNINISYTFRVRNDLKGEECVNISLGVTYLDLRR